MIFCVRCKQKPISVLNHVSTSCTMYALVALLLIQSMIAIPL